MGGRRGGDGGKKDDGERTNGQTTYSMIHGTLSMDRVSLCIPLYLRPGDFLSGRGEGNVAGFVKRVMSGGVIDRVAPAVLVLAGLCEGALHVGGVIDRGGPPPGPVGRNRNDGQLRRVVPALSSSTIDVVLVYFSRGCGGESFLLRAGITVSCCAVVESRDLSINKMVLRSVDGVVLEFLRIVELPSLGEEMRGEMAGEGGRGRRPQHTTRSSWEIAPASSWETEIAPARSGEIFARCCCARQQLGDRAGRHVEKENTLVAPVECMTLFCS